jgi:hypothetical protein
MAWYDDAWEMAKDWGGAALDWAKENPKTAGAITGLGLNAAFGKGEDNLQAMGLGAAAGGAAGYFANMPAAGNWGGAGGGAPVAGMPAATPVSSAATMGTGVDMGKPGETAVGGYGGYAGTAGNTGVTGDTGGSMMSDAKAGLGKVRAWAGENEDVLRLAGKGVSAYLGSQAKREAAAPVKAYNEQYRGQADAATAANAANVGKKNALVDQQVSDYLAIDPQRAGRQAYAGTLSRISGQAQKAATEAAGRGHSAATVEADKRRGRVGATTGATTAAEVARSGAEETRRAGLSGIQYAPQATPQYDSSYVSGLGTASDTGDTTGGAYSLYEDVLGLSKKKAETQVGK